MGKIVDIKLDGDLENGFRVTLEIRSESKDSAKQSQHSLAEEHGALPANLDLSNQVKDWQGKYRQLEEKSRHHDQYPVIRPKRITITETIHDLIRFRIIRPKKITLAFLESNR